MLAPVLPWPDVPVVEVPLCGLVYVTDHDWHPSVALGVLADPHRARKPVHLLDHDGRLHVVDGRHRIVGWTLAGRSTVRARVQAGCDETCPCVRLPRQRVAV
jgi:hypothetical protein